jgi:hypothetical protein
MGLFADLLGTLASTFQIGKSGVKLKNNAAELEVKAADGTTDAPVTASKVKVSGDEIVVNSDATEADADWKMTLKRPSTGMTANVVFTLPPTDGSPGQVPQTDGDGNLAWVSAGATEFLVHVDTTTLAHDDTSPQAMFTLPEDAIVVKAQVIVDTPFNGTAPTLSIGVSGTVSKYMATTQNDLKGAAGTIYEVCPGLEADESSENIIATYAADSSDAGSARILVHYTIPA